MYKIRDCQFDDRYFRGDEGIIFKTKKEAELFRVAFIDDEYDDIKIRKEI